MKIARNMGLVDRILRTVLAAAVAVLVITGVLNGAAAIVLGILGGIFLLTAIVGVCPLYLLLRISTRRRAA
jgi:hypothetical protein